MSDEDPSVTTTVAAIEAAFADRWGVWLSETRWWWATRTHALSAEELSAGCAPFVHADNPDELTERIRQQERLPPTQTMNQTKKRPAGQSPSSSAFQETTVMPENTQDVESHRSSELVEKLQCRRFDTSVPHPARVYNYWLGGKDAHPPDRRAAEEVMRLRPEVVASARANRNFLARVARFLAADCGIRQFLDIGTGLPAPDNTHDVAQDAAPESRVVYVDNDPLVLAYARALLTSKVAGLCDYIDADLRDPRTLLRKAACVLDFSQPIGVLLLAVLHFLSDPDDPGGVVKTLAGALAPGSYLAISHLTTDYAPTEVSTAAAAYNALAPAPVAIIPRTREQVTGLFGGLPLLEPGVVRVTDWRPTSPLPHRQPCDLYAGVARIPGDVDHEPN